MRESDSLLDQELGDANLMMSGFQHHQEQLVPVGGDQAFIDKLEAELKEVLRLNAVQESKKSELKEATVAVDEAREALRESLKEGRKKVKFALPQESWVRCGVTASK